MGSYTNNLELGKLYYVESIGGFRAIVKCNAIDKTTNRNNLGKLFTVIIVVPILHTERYGPNFTFTIQETNSSYKTILLEDEPT